MQGRSHARFEGILDDRSCLAPIRVQTELPEYVKSVAMADSLIDTNMYKVYKNVLFSY